MLINNYLDKKNVFKIVRNSLSVCLLIFLLQLVTVISLHNDTVKDYEKKMGLIIETEGLDLNLMCNVVSCSYVVTDEDLYKNVNGILKHSNDMVDVNKFLYIFNKNFETIININNVYFVVDNIFFLEIISTIVVITTFVTFIIFIIMYTLMYVADTRRNIMEKSILKNNLETRLQRDMTESLHHEMGTPIAIIKTLVEDLYKMLLPCKFTKDHICRYKTFKEQIKQCETCVMFTNDNERKIDIIASRYYEKIILSIESLNALQTIIGNSKHIKYSNGTVSLLEILVNVVSSSNSSKVNKIEATYSNQDILDKYACGIGLQNGEMLLVMNAMLTNCVEAKATKITVSANINNDVLDIFIQDNGRGIRDRNDRIVQDLNIFNYGYSTKQKNGDSLKPMSFMEKIIDKYLNFNNVNPNSEIGVGLSVNKRILNKSGGDITLMHTNELGTMFKVTIPYKVRKKK